jgi:hypothetical protein
MVYFVYCYESLQNYGDFMVVYIHSRLAVKSGWDDEVGEFRVSF